jgi:Ca2+/H+ antiporter
MSPGLYGVFLAIQNVRHRDYFILPNSGLLLLTLAVSTLTFASARTNVLLGAVHLLLFLACLMLIFEK